MKGHCALCGELLDLIDSHVISKFLYRHLNKVNERVVSVYKGRAAYLGIHHKKPLLCKCCDNFLGVAEKHFCDNVLYRGKNVFDSKCISQDESSDAIDLIDDFNSQKLTVFCLSLLWRWHLYDSNFKLGLYADRIREYLLRVKNGEMLLNVDSVSILASFASNVDEQDLIVFCQDPFRTKSGEWNVILVVMRLEFIICLGRPYISDSRLSQLKPLPNLFLNSKGYLFHSYIAARSRQTDLVGKLKSDKN